MHIVLKNPTCVLNPIALRKAKTVYNFGLSECNRVKVNGEMKKFCCFTDFLPSHWGLPALLVLEGLINSALQISSTSMQI